MKKGWFSLLKSQKLRSAISAILIIFQHGTDYDDYANTIAFILNNCDQAIMYVIKVDS